MAYKDKDKQREADKERQRRHRERIGYVRAGYKPSSELGFNKGVTEQGVTKGVTETHDVPVSDQPTKVYPLSIHKRGKDIKTFADLPPDVQATINRLSESNEEKAKRTAAAIKYQRIFPDSYEPHSDQDFTKALAQAGPGHVRVSKPGDADYVPMCETTRKYIDEANI